MAARQQKWMILLVLALLAGTLLFVILDKPPALPQVMLLPPTPLAIKSGRIPDRWIPRNWTWLRRLCLFVVGPPRQAVIDIDGLRFADTVAEIMAKKFLGPPQIESNGVAVWLLTDDRLAPRLDGVLIQSRSRLTTSDLGPASLSNGELTADVFPRLQEETIDLSTRLRLASDPNFVAAVRAQLTRSQKLLILDVREAKTATNRCAFVLTADEIDAGGNKISRKGPGK